MGEESAPVSPACISAILETTQNNGHPKSAYGVDLPTRTPLEEEAQPRTLLRGVRQQHSRARSVHLEMLYRPLP